MLLMHELFLIKKGIYISPLETVETEKLTLKILLEMEEKFIALALMDPSLEIIH